MVRVYSAENPMEPALFFQVSPCQGEILSHPGEGWGAHKKKPAYDKQAF